MQEAAKTFMRRKLVLESKTPQSGAYYWYPQPKNGKIDWDILTFYDSQYDGNTEHSKIWVEVLQTLSMKWNKDFDALRRRLGHHYTALPRGRVNKVKMKRPEGGYGPGYTICYGGQVPEIPDSRVLNIVKRLFVLKDALVQEIEDEHEHILPDDLRVFEKVFGKIGLVADTSMADAMYADFEADYE